MGHRRNELGNAAGVILKFRIFVAVQDLKISFICYWFLEHTQDFEVEISRFHFILVSPTSG